MAVFHADKGYHFSEDGARPWAHFTRPRAALPGTPFTFETTDPRVIERLSTVVGVRRVDG